MSVIFFAWIWSDNWLYIVCGQNDHSWWHPWGSTIRALRQSVICPNKWAVPSLPGISVKPVFSFKLLVITCTAEVMSGLGNEGVFLQTSNRNYQEAFLELRKEMITCPTYEPFTRTKTAVCARHGEVESNHLIPCEDSCWCMWPMLYWQVLHAVVSAHGVLHEGPQRCGIPVRSNASLSPANNDTRFQQLKLACYDQLR